MRKTIALFSCLLLAGCFGNSSKKFVPPPTFRPQMIELAGSYKALQPYLFHSSQQSIEDREAIMKLLDSMEKNFHRVDQTSPSYLVEPGFASTLEMVHELIADSKQRLGEGRDEYAIWRLRSVGNYCASCHTRFEVRADFNNLEAPANLAPYDEAQFYFVTRQFDKARSRFLELARTGKDQRQRLDALRKWLVIEVRVHPDPNGALLELKSLLASGKIRGFAAEEVEGWVSSLERIGALPPEGLPVSRARYLISESLRSDSHESDPVGLLRGTGFLHAALERNQIPIQERSAALLLLGKAYSELSDFFPEGLAANFLELCIRENSGTRDAQEAYRLYEDIISLGFTGSAGTKLPDDVQRKFDLLKEIAFREPVIAGKK